jgi:hypothetical protein
VFTRIARQANFIGDIDWHIHEMPFIVTHQFKLKQRIRRKSVPLLNYRNTFTRPFSPILR